MTGTGQLQRITVFLQKLRHISPQTAKPALERAHGSGNFQRQQMVIPIFSAVAGACKILRPQFVKFA